MSVDVMTVIMPEKNFKFRSVLRYSSFGDRTRQNVELGTSSKIKSNYFIVRLKVARELTNLVCRTV